MPLRVLAFLPFLSAILFAADPKDDNGIVAPGAKLEKLWSEGEFTEGPAYGPDGCVYFSDIGNRIMKFDPATGKTTRVPRAERPGQRPGLRCRRAGSSPPRAPTRAAIGASPSPRRTARSAPWPTSGTANASTAPTT